MAVNKPTGDNARKGAVKKRSQTKTTIGGASGWTKRDRSSGEFMAVKKAGQGQESCQEVQGSAGRKESCKEGAEDRSIGTDSRITHWGAYGVRLWSSQ
ncbi:hypothetical protein [Bradyrhizobium sp. WSM3983]|uniref:hypothetical protein n=1 Tax=Bradyrhizobium sp. WSM3983 TaxID=1038867 RepID=UPI0009FD79E7|nr:hypothetical protein [Bradyrhizobium sp. WSM3983]